LDAEPLAMKDIRDIARTIAEVARERKAVTIVVGFSRLETAMRIRTGSKGSSGNGEAAWLGELRQRDPSWPA
jgi:hypothetical protein